MKDIWTEFLNYDFIITYFFNFLVFPVLSISIIALRYIPHPLDDGAFHFRATQVLTNFDSIISMFQAFES